jgi:hypothetical protein
MGRWWGNFQSRLTAVEDALLVYADSQVIEYQEAYYIPEYL